MAQAGNSELVDAFEQFFRNYYDHEVKQLAQRYPNEQRSLFIDWQDLYRFDPDLADDYITQPEQLQQYAEEALRLYDLPIDVSLGRAHVRIRGLPETESPEIRAIRARHMNRLVRVRGIVRKATGVRPKIEEAAFECQLCGTLTRIPQSTGDFQEPHECQGCERQGPFRVNFDQSEFVDAQKLRMQESPEGLRGGETPQALDVNVEDDITGEVTPGDHVSATGVLRLEQKGNQQEPSPIFDFYMEGISVDVDEEQFEDMDITEEDKKQIYTISEQEDVYEQMVASIAPAIYGYDEEKLAMMLQLFSGVSKQLPDGSKIRGDLHMLLIGDPGTGKCLAGETEVLLADGRTVQIGDLVESNLTDPKPIDDGWWDDVDIAVPSLQPDGTISTQRATKVWKREAPKHLYRIGTTRGRELEVTPSHPLFVQSETGWVPVRADELSVGMGVATTAQAGGTGVHGHGHDGHSHDHDHAHPQPTKATVSTDGGPIAFDVETDRIASIETVEVTDPWVYDLEVAGTHNYVSNGIVSHNSQMLSYIQNIAPRSVYTSGKGSSSAGLCVTGDTAIQTEDGPTPIREIATPHLPEPVETETAVESELPVSTFDPDSETVETRRSSHVWRMPPKPCCRLETADGLELEASKNTPVLTRGDDGFEWQPISALEAGDRVAVSDDGQVALEDANPVDEDDSTPDIHWEEVISTADTGEKELFDLTVPETHNFLANGIVTHNTAAAVKDDFGDGQQWTLEAGALVLADQGIAAVDELDKMRSEDRSAMHQALEQQEISISKAGINATLKSRCSLLGAANPKYGRFDHYEPIGEQIDLEPALISRFDLIFTVTDDPDEEKDRNLAEHIINTNYAGELSAQREKMTSLDVSSAEIDKMTEKVDPAIDAELLRKYIAYAKQNCHPRMTQEAREAIRDFYVDLRSKGTDEDAAIPVTARKLEGLVRLSEASARIRLSDTVELDDAERVIDLVYSCLQDIGVDPETGEFDADIVEAGTSKSQRDRIKNIKGLITDIEQEYDDGAPVDIVLDRADEIGMDRSKAEHEIDKLKQKGEVYEPSTDHLRTT